MQYTVCLFIALLFLSSLPLLAVEPDPADGLDRVTRQFRAYILAPDTPKVDGFVAALGEDGSWKDIDYHSPQRANWPTGAHVNRMMQMTQTLCKAEKAPVGLAEAIHRALGYWIKNDPQCPNWWYTHDTEKCAVSHRDCR